MIDVEEELCIRWGPIPGTAQEQFFDDDTPDAALLFCGGWGSGKTMTLWGKALKLSALNAPLPLIWVVPRTTISSIRFCQSSRNSTRTSATRGS
jgi:hypothetical protein